MHLSCEHGRWFHQDAHRPRVPPIASSNARSRRPPGAGLSWPRSNSPPVQASPPIALCHQRPRDNRGLYHDEQPQPSREAYLSTHV
jgi:hypothetical protein